MAATNEKKSPSMTDLFYEAYKKGEKTMDEIPPIFRLGVQMRITEDNAKSVEEQAALIGEEELAGNGEETKEEKKAKAKAASKKKDAE